MTCPAARCHSGTNVFIERYVQSPLNRTGCNCNCLLCLAATCNDLPLRANCKMARVKIGALGISMMWVLSKTFNYSSVLVSELRWQFRSLNELYSVQRKKKTGAQWRNNNRIRLWTRISAIQMESQKKCERKKDWNIAFILWIYVCL